MKKTFILMLLLCLAFSSAHSQYIVATGGGDPLTYTDKIDTITNYHIQILYELKFMPDTLERENYDRRTTVLNLSPEGISNYCEYSLFKTDSIKSQYIENGKIRLSVMNKAMKYGGRVFDRYIIVKSWPEKNKLFHIETIGFDGKFSYTEDLPDFGWEVDFSQTKEIGGYTCHSAKGRYAGRDYQAWFTMDIPINDGPWKFQGLPGLILEVASLDEEYSYTCMSIRKTEGSLVVTGLDVAGKTTRENFLKAYKRYKKNPAAALSALGDKIQSSTNFKNRKDRAINPQEKY